MGVQNPMVGKLGKFSLICFSFRLDKSLNFDESIGHVRN